MAKEIRTEAELSDLVRVHVEKNHRERLDGAQFIKIVSVGPTIGGAANWRIAHSGQAGGLSIALDEAEAELTKEYSLMGSSTLSALRGGR